MLTIHRASHLRLLILLMGCRVLLLETAESRELGCTRLERTAQEELRRQERREIHVHCCTRGCHVTRVLMIYLPVSGSVD